MLAYWGDYRSLDGNTDLYGQLLTSFGAVTPGWPDTGLMIARASDDQRSAAGLAHPDGSFIVGIADFRNLVIGGTSEDTYLSRVLPSGLIDPTWPREGFQAVNRPGQDFPQMMLWVAPDTLITACFYAQPDALGRPLLQQVAITPSGPTLPWGPSGIVYQWRPNEYLTTMSLVPDGEGGLFAFFDEVLAASSTDAQADLYIMRIGRDGQPAAGWETGARPVSVAPGNQEYGVMCSDGADGLYAAWADARNGSGLPFPDYTPFEDIRLLRLTREGAPYPGWPAEGLLVTDAPGWQYLPAIEPDGTGGVYVSFQDVGTIGLTRVQGDGTFAPGWAKDGIPVSNVPAYDTDSRLLRDGAGGVFVMFFDVSAGSTYLQHVLASGAVDRLWPGGGTPVSITSDADIVPDGAGGCYVAGQGQLVRFGPPLIVVARYSVGGPVPVKLAEATIEVEPGRVRLTWHGVGAAAADLTVQRRPDGVESWQSLGAPTVRGSDLVEYEDTTVEPGIRYAYRIAKGAEVISEEQWVDMPALVFALAGARPNPAVARELSVEFTLTGQARAQLEVLDLAGRREYVRALTGLPAGRHTLPLAEARLAPGVHWLRLSEGEKRAQSRVVVLR